MLEENQYLRFDQTVWHAEILQPEPPLNEEDTLQNRGQIERILCFMSIAEVQAAEFRRAIQSGRNANTGFPRACPC